MPRCLWVCTRCGPCTPEGHTAAVQQLVVLVLHSWCFARDFANNGLVENDNLSGLWQDVKSSTVMKHPELYKETMNTRRQDFTANLTRSIIVAMFDPIAN